MKTNEIYNIDFLANKLPDKCADLIICDPPYFEVKGDFDFKFESFEAYLQQVDVWARECKRLLSETGTLFWWGDAKKIAYSQIILDKYFNLENSLIWEKNECQNKRADFTQSRCFAPVTERLLMYSNEIDQTGLERIKLDINNFSTLRAYAKQVFGFIGKFNKEIERVLGNQKADHFFRFASTQWDLPTLETYNALILHFKIDKMAGFREYESLRIEYESLRRYFNNVELKLTDVLKFSQEAHITGKYAHPTQKPPKLCATLIETCSRPNSLIVVPFVGSGVECEQAIRLKRNFIGFEIDKDYCQLGKNRVDLQKLKPTMF